MTTTTRAAIAIFGVALFTIGWRAIDAWRALEKIRLEIAATESQRQQATGAEQAKLQGEIDAVRAAMRDSQAEAERWMRRARTMQEVAARTRAAKQEEFEAHRHKHWLAQCLPWSEVSKQLRALDEDIERQACRENSGRLEYLKAQAQAKRDIAALERQEIALKQRLAALPDPVAGSAPPTWLSIFLGTYSVRDPGKGARVTTPPPANPPLPAPSSYHLPDLQPGPPPVHRTTLFEALNVCNAAQFAKSLPSAGMQLQDAVIRLYKARDSGVLVDTTVGCKTVTLNKPVAEAIWTKNEYFLAQTDYGCGIAPTSDSRSILRQWALKKGEAKSGTPVANVFDSKHLVGDAIDQSARCQGPGTAVPFDFDPAGRVIYVRLDGQGRALDDPAVREAIVARRRAEFSEDYARLLEANGDLQGWEAAQYDAALYELLRFPAGTGIYGAHVMSFEAGLKSGLVGAFCGIRFDPIHSEMQIGGSAAECGEKLGGNPACYRVDSRGKPDCWRGSPKWNQQVDEVRRRFWGPQYATRYGEDRMTRYLSKGAPHLGVK